VAREVRRVGRALRAGEARLQNIERSEEHTSELQSRFELVCRLLLEKKKSGCARSHGRSARTGCRDSRSSSSACAGRADNRPASPARRQSPPSPPTKRARPEHKPARLNSIREFPTHALSGGYR